MPYLPLQRQDQIHGKDKNLHQLRVETVVALGQAVHHSDSSDWFPSPLNTPAT